MAAEHDHAVICQVLIENGILYDALDDSLNNGKHVLDYPHNNGKCDTKIIEKRSKIVSVDVIKINIIALPEVRLRSDLNSF